MNVAEWILVGFLSVALLVFIIIGIIVLIKCKELIDETKKVVVKGQDIADTTNDIVENVKGMTSVGNIVKAVSDNVVKSLTPDEKPKKTTKK